MKIKKFLQEDDGAVAAEYLILWPLPPSFGRGGLGPDQVRCLNCLRTGPLISEPEADPAPGGVTSRFVNILFWEVHTRWRAGSEPNDVWQLSKKPKP